ncbi:hypothetical protein [Streptomyces sp. ICBB 8177]|uniref:hypothetical protein n=1 Tax=Streptomyces sp. ICBB 8177 TaxID=563922 RepID=UPI0013052790|nr:hypothetical protein [Streptomyces sp. ICBB 8177]
MPYDAPAGRTMACPVADGLNAAAAVLAVAFVRRPTATQQVRLEAVAPGPEPLVPR